MSETRYIDVPVTTILCPVCGADFLPDAGDFELPGDPSFEDIAREVQAAISAQVEVMLVEHYRLDHPLRYRLYTWTDWKWPLTWTWR